MALTKSQIRARINQLSYEKNKQTKELEDYKKSLNYANKLVEKLRRSKDYLNESKDNMKSYFTINNKTADNGKINTTREELNNIIRKLTGTIIPSIRTKISELTNNINRKNNEINQLRRSYQTAEE